MIMMIMMKKYVQNFPLFYEEKECNPMKILQ